MKYNLFLKQYSVKVHGYYVEADNEKDARIQAQKMFDDGISHEVHIEDLSDEWECETLSQSNIDQLLTEYGFSYPEDYYDYIVRSYKNGQKQQARMLFRALTMPERESFIAWSKIEQHWCLPEIEMIKLNIFLCQTGA